MMNSLIKNGLIFGICTENNGNFLNEGLINQKQEFGGRGIVHDFYLISTKSRVNI